MLNRVVQIAAVAMLIASPAVLAQGSTGASGDVDRKTLQIQEQVEGLFAEGEKLSAEGEHERAYFKYKRAFGIYKDDLAPIGDKYAQYMVGFMYYTGTGVEEDPVLASAWYRLAAESSYPELLAVRDQALNALTDVDRLRSDQLFLEIRRQYSDAVLLLDLLRDDLESLRGITGSRAGGVGSTVTVFDPRTGIGRSGDQLNREIRNRIKARVKRIGELIDLSRFDTDPDDLDIAALEDLVNNYVETINDR